MLIGLAIFAAFIAGVLLSAGIKKAVKTEQEALLAEALRVRKIVDPHPIILPPSGPAPAPVETPKAT